jgi:F0F1-type ATP synthase assembly protein I
MAPDQKNKRSSLRDIVSKPLIQTDSKTMQYSGLGVQLAATIVIFFFIGYWLDGVFDTKPILMLIFTFLGFGGAFYNFFLTIQDLSKKEKEKRDEAKSENVKEDKKI